MERKVLVIERDEDILRLCKNTLEERGFEVKGITDPREGKEIIKREEFQVVIIDHSLDGRLFEDLKKEKSDLTAILTVGDEPISVAIEAINKGFSGLLKKPFSKEELLSVVEDCFNKASILEENIKLKTLIPLYELIERFIRAETEDQILKELLNAIREYVGAERISIMLYEEGEGVLKIKESVGLEKEIIEKTRLKPGERIAGWVFKNKKPVILNNRKAEYSELEPFLKKKEILSAISVPMISVPVYAKEKVIGVLNVSKIKEGRPFTKSDLEMVFVICKQAAMAIENLRSMNEKAEKLKIKAILEQYMAPEIAEFLISSRGDLSELGEIRDVVILFADIKDFTPLVQEIPIQKTRLFMNEFFGVLADTVFQFKGTINKFVGDAGLVIFGFPNPMEDTERKAVSCAIKIRESFFELKERWQKEEEAFKKIGIGIGISKGKVFIGNVGSKKRFDFTVIGPDVNLAQRLAADAGAGEILVSRSIKDCLKGFTIKEKGVYQLKGIKDPVSVYEVI